MDCPAFSSHFFERNQRLLPPISTGLGRVGASTSLKDTGSRCCSRCWDAACCYPAARFRSSGMALSHLKSQKSLCSKDIKKKQKTQIYENLCNVYSRTWNMMIFTGRFGATQQLLGPPRAPFNCTSREILNITFKSLLEIRSSVVGGCFSKWTFTNPHC